MLTATKSIWTPDEWSSESEVLKKWAGQETVTDDTVARLKIRLWKLILDSHVFFARNYAKCLDKESNELVPVDPWFGQTCLEYAIEWQRRNGYAQRVIEIKPRQVGWTQWLISRAVWTCLHPNRNVVIFVPDTDVVRKMMVRVSTIINNLPVWMQPMRSTNNVNLIEFENPNQRERYSNPGLGSSLGCVVPADFRGATNLNLVILSEFSKYEKSLKVSPFMNSLMGGMSESVNTCVVVDTTPNGFDTYYFPRVQEAVENNPTWCSKWYSKTKMTREDVISGALGDPDNPSDWIPAFTRWTDHEAYSTADESPRAELPKMTKKEWLWMTEGEPIGTVERFGYEEEVRLQRDHHATIPQLFFRRTKITRNKQPDWRSRLLYFRQELASDHESLFVTYGRAPFDPRCLDLLYHQCKDPYAKGIFKKDEKGVYVQNDPDYSEWEQVRIWETCEEGESYVIGVDVAHAYENPEADDSFAQVLRRRDFRQVCAYQAKVPPHKLIEQLHLMYEFYGGNGKNPPLLSIETDEGVAYDMVRKLYDMGDTNQYFFKRIDRAQPESGTNPYIGWETNPRTRGPLQENLVALISHTTPEGRPDPQIVIRDIETWRQLQNVERQPDGIIEGGRTHDDAFMALAIACYTSMDPEHAFAVPRKEERQVMLGYNLMRDRVGATQQTGSFAGYRDDGIGREQESA